MGGDSQVRNYFDTQGFERWRRIYGETDDVNSVQVTTSPECSRRLNEGVELDAVVPLQMDIRQGHAQTVEKVGALPHSPLQETLLLQFIVR